MTERAATAVVRVPPPASKCERVIETVRVALDAPNASCSNEATVNF